MRMKYIAILIIVIALLGGVGAYLAKKEQQNSGEELKKVVKKIETIKSITYASSESQEASESQPPLVIEKMYWAKKGLNGKWKYRSDVISSFGKKSHSAIVDNYENGMSFIYGNDSQTVKIQSPLDVEKYGDELQLDILSKNPEVVEEVLYEGKKCLIVNIIDEDEKSKIWVWKDNGLIIRQERYHSNGDAVIWIMKDIEINKEIPDSIFEVPQGYKVL